MKNDPRFHEFLRLIKLPITSIDDLTGVNSESVVVFSDYSLNSKSYEVYAYFLTDYSNLGLLISMLKQVKKKHKIVEREIKYERRNDGMKKKAFPDWISVVRNYPGLIHILVYDKRIDELLYFKEATLKLKKALKALGLKDSSDLYKRMIRAISFFVVLAPYLRSKHRLLWIGDEDDMLDTEARRELLSNALGFLADESFGVPLAAFGIGTKVVEPEGSKINKDFKEVLSIPDMAAGSFAGSLQCDLDNRFRCPDDAAIEIIQEFSKFCSIEDFSVDRHPCCALGISTFDIFFNDEGEPYCLPSTIQIVYDRENDPLIKRGEQDA
jgi:hypothetical protein